MKTFIIILILLSHAAFAAKPQARKVSNSQYFICELEREATDSKIFKKEYHFPMPTEKGETYELKGSMRWNKFSLVFSQSGEVKIRISEGDTVAEKIHQMGKGPQFESFKIQVDLKSDGTVIPYHIQCSPE